MKQYIVEPKYKKSVVEVQVFKKKINGRDHYLRYSDCWRWGGFAIAVPETREEIEEYKQHIGYAGATDEEVFEDFGAETWEDIALPAEGEEEIGIFEDHGWNAEMIECWDGGCWTEWNIHAYGEGAMSEEECEEEAERLSEIYYEEYEEGLEAEGWEYVDNDYWVTEPVVRPVKEGQSIYEAYEDKPEN